MQWSRVGAGLGAAALCVGFVPGAAVAEGPPDYRPASGAKPIKGRESSIDGPLIEPAAVYTDTIGPGEKKYYRVQLDDSSDAFVSTVVAPPSGTATDFTDGVRVSLASADGGTKCSTDLSLAFGDETARPLAGYASRRIERGRSCQEAGEYFYTVERVGSASGAWPVELTYMAEPGLKSGGDDQREPTDWSSKAPASPSSTSARKARGGTGFNDAEPVDEGVWRDDIEPGESRFYRVPVAWGKQLFLRAQLANSGAGSTFFSVYGLRLELYNTARGQVAGNATGYTGEPTGVELGTAPAAYANRSTGKTDAVGAMRFQGWYYVQVTLSPEVPAAVPLTLKVDLRGTARPGPPYDGDAAAAGFGLDDPSEAAGTDSTMRVVGIAGIGAGAVLVLVMAAWYYVGRRRSTAV
ncbi:hypothetical protein [Streptomyces sp. NPDC006289]|uniref:hypothetical protein n=1 Tax=Streptomyces sp. NPDC006289 TaxID=3156744 RepID=UPI0033BBD8AC